MNIDNEHKMTVLDLLGVFAILCLGFSFDDAPQQQRKPRSEIETSTLIYPAHPQPAAHRANVLHDPYASMSASEKMRGVVLEPEQ